MAGAERRAPPCTPLSAAAVQVRRDLAKSLGRPLDSALRRRMEARAGAAPASLGLDHRRLEAAADLGESRLRAAHAWNQGRRRCRSGDRHPWPLEEH